MSLGSGVITLLESAPPSYDDRIARGKEARRRVAVEALGHYEPAPSRADPVMLLLGQEASRVPDLVAIRHTRMAASVFGYYRGSAVVMAADLAALPSPKLRVQLSGDAHVGNFGVFGAPDRRIVFDITDFDETTSGPFEWDVKRLAASLEIAGRQGDFAARDRRRVVMAAAHSYRASMRGFAASTNLDVWYARLELKEVLKELRTELKRDRFKSVEDALLRARTRDNLHSLSKLTHEVDGEPRFISQPPLLVPADELFDDERSDAFYLALTELLRSYRRTLQTDRRHLLEQYRPVQIARKVVGVGSVGTRTWVMLLLGRNAQDPLILQVKEADASVLERYAGGSGYPNHGERVVAGQHLMQAQSDIFLGWQRVPGEDGVDRDYYVRQLHDMQATANVGGMRPSVLGAYGRLCGWTLARAHARSGDRVAIAAYLGGKDRFEQAMYLFADAYADQAERDHAAVADAVAAGRISSTPEV